MDDRTSANIDRYVVDASRAVVEQKVTWLKVVQAHIRTAVGLICRSPGKPDAEIRKD